eukprot:COSAG04_NODE_34_length_34523_cov_40.302446_11_plen_53_part_00
MCGVSSLSEGINVPGGLPSNKCNTSNSKMPSYAEAKKQGALYVSILCFPDLS